jgi:hypothetical protein
MQPPTCRQRRTVIEQVAEELLAPENTQELVEGHRIVELIEHTPLDPADGEPGLAPKDSVRSSLSRLLRLCAENASAKLSTSILLPLFLLDPLESLSVPVG